jgi:hypothetical protein
VTTKELPDNVRALIRTCIPTLDALEVLLYLEREQGEYWGPKQISDALLPSEVPAQAVVAHLAMFQSHGLVIEQHGVGFRYRPISPEVGEAVAGLVRAYIQRPVTLVRTVYSIAEEHRIQAWADAFKFKKDG